MANGNNKRLKAYVRYDGTGRVIAGSLILQRFKPKVGNWKEITAYECCNETPSTTTTTSTLLTTTTTTSTEAPVYSYRVSTISNATEPEVCTNGITDLETGGTYYAAYPLFGLSGNTLYTDPGLTTPATFTEGYHAIMVGYPSGSLALIRIDESGAIIGVGTC